VAKIRVLPPELANQIAAGEVVERPASVVKELVENALDADASRIDVVIDGGGITRISVQDDGHGMSPEDARLSVARHATSKLVAIAELMQLRSYGFRGEALPSIASVSRLSMTTRAHHDDAGTELSIENGHSRVRPLGAAVGTRVEVLDLFFNVPARRKFLRSSATEAGHVSEVIEQAALSRPDVTFTLTRDGRQVREYLRVSTRGERVEQVLGDSPLARCEGTRGPLSLEAFLSRPEHARNGATGLRLFVNGRPVRDRAVAATIAHAYGSVLERGRYPRGAAYIELPLELVDVNVHPQKAEVRFADPRALTDAMYGILSRALATAFSLPPRAPKPGPELGRRVVTRDEPLTRAFDFGRSERQATNGAAPLKPVAANDEDDGYEEEPAPTLVSIPPIEPPAPAPEPPLLAVRDSTPLAIRPSPGTTWSSLRFVAQIRQTYLLCEGEDGLYVLDQHAAAERVTFTKLRREYQSQAVPSQALLFPVMCEVSPADIDLVEAHAAAIAELGLDVRVRGAETLSIHGLPKLLQRASPERLLRDLLTELSRKGERGFSDAVDLALATMACHGSLRAGDAVTASEAGALLVALDEADFAGHCPHGRPVVTVMGFAELERKVGRR
jgi:DNA mismatch repair protein MutL